MRNLKYRTRQRRYNLKKDYWDMVADKSTISWTPPEGLKNTDAVQWGALLDMWSSSQKMSLSLFTKAYNCFNSTNLDRC